MIVPAATATAMFCLLIGLGTWQIRRLHWKEGILRAISRAEAAPAIPLPAHPGPFQKVEVRGVWRNDLYLIYGADVLDTPQGPQLGGQLIEPLRQDDGSLVLVDRGWVPDRAIRPIASTIPVTLEGYVRAPERQRLFTPNDDVASHRVYTLNPSNMAAALGLANTAPFTVVQLGSDVPGVFPAPATSLPRPPNDHLSYAITWFGLAAVLAAVFGIWLRSAKQDSRLVIHDTDPD